MKQIVECVPNFSEGRNLTKVDAIVAAMREVSGAFLLDRSSDRDHNRSVVTMVGEPEAVAEAAIRGVGKAAELIDLTQQAGAHPRVGATDVVPFIPIEGVTLEQCAEMAERVGREIWDRYRIPVYLYEAAARRPERMNLENIRRGQFEGLREEVLRDPDRSPDIGEPRLHPTAGATVVGARTFLIAYNINLNTPDTEIAKRIAKAIRFSDGGLRNVKAIGVNLRERHLAQVSMNLTDFEQTPVHRVFEAVRREASRYGVSIAGSEIVGLIPRRALESAAEFYLQIENFSSGKVLENHVENFLSGASSEGSLELSMLAAPLGGAVSRRGLLIDGDGATAALAGAMAANLGRMIASALRADRSGRPEILDELETRFLTASQALTKAIDRDAASSEPARSAHKTREEWPKAGSDDPPAQLALRHATEVPLEIARIATDVSEWLGQLEVVCHASKLLEDIHIARSMSVTAARGALEHLRVQCGTINDPSLVGSLLSEAHFLETRVGAGTVSTAR